MLEWDPYKRATAAEMLKHPFLAMEENYDVKVEEPVRLEQDSDHYYYKEEMAKMTEGESAADEADIGGAYSEKDMVADDPWLDSDPYFSDERDEDFRPEKRLQRDLENGRNLNNSFG